MALPIYDPRLDPYRRAGARVAQAANANNLAVSLRGAGLSPADAAVAAANPTALDQQPAHLTGQQYAAAKHLQEMNAASAADWQDQLTAPFDPYRRTPRV